MSDTVKPSQIKAALVLSGGVVRAAAWHLGVALALKEQGIVLGNRVASQNIMSSEASIIVDTFVGSSAGSLIGTLLACNVDPEIIRDQVMGLATAKKKFQHRPFTYRDMFKLGLPSLLSFKRKPYDPFAHLPLTARLLLKPLYMNAGFFTTEGIRQYLIREFLAPGLGTSPALDKFAQLPNDLFVVTTQLDHSRKVIFSQYLYPNMHHDSTAQYRNQVSVSQAVAASMSVPPFYAPYPLYNEEERRLDYYIDGEIRETLSHHVAIDHGRDLIINSWGYTPYHFHDEVGSLVHYGIPTILVQSFYLMVQKKIVSARAQNFLAKDLLDTMKDFLDRERVSDHLSREIFSILEAKLQYRSHLKFIDIYPDHQDYELFFTGFFSLQPASLSKVIAKGRERAMHLLDRHLKAV